MIIQQNWSDIAAWFSIKGKSIIQCFNNPFFFLNEAITLNNFVLRNYFRRVYRVTRRLEEKSSLTFP